MRIPTVAGTRTLGGEPPRSTAYYYADLERLKRKNGHPDPIQEPQQNPDELSEYVESNEVVNEGGIREIPPLRDRRQWSLPEYSTPENSRKIDTYSTAGTFPMPEPKEKEPLLAELELVGRLPLNQLESSSGVRRSRSWYLCCPNVADEEMSRESSWRYSSLRPVTAPPVAGQNGINVLQVASESSGRGREDVVALRAERDALARALAAERARAAAAARAHDARLAELHGVIAELVRRRAQDKHAGAIPEEEVSDECESTTQPAGELDHDADRSRTEQNDTFSLLSPSELPTPQESKVEREPPDDSSDTSAHDDIRVEQPRVEVESPNATDNCDTSLNLSERDSDPCLYTARCARSPRARSAGGSCARERGSPDQPALCTGSAGRCESRQAKIASRVRLRKTEDSDSNHQLGNEEWWCAAAAERLALDVAAQAELREALAAADNHGSALSSHVAAWRARCARLQADRRVLRAALARATDTAHRLYCACAVQESSAVAVCLALRAADRALETYDVLLALAETTPGDSPERSAAEAVARQLLARLEGEQAALGEPLLSPGPWLQHHAQVCSERWSAECESRLRRHAARLKADTVALRGTHPPPHLFSYHDIDEEELCGSGARFSMCEMEAAVALQDALAAPAPAAAPPAAPPAAPVAAAPDNPAPANTAPAAPVDQRPRTDTHKSEPRPRRRRARHWLDAQASETDL